MERACLAHGAATAIAESVRLLVEAHNAVRKEHAKCHWWETTRRAELFGKATGLFEAAKLLQAQAVSIVATG